MSGSSGATRQPRRRLFLLEHGDDLAVFGGGGSLLEEGLGLVGGVISNGFSHGFEHQADAFAVRLLPALGFERWTYANMLLLLDVECPGGCPGPGLLSTHPGVKARIEAVGQ